MSANRKYWPVCDEQVTSSPVCHSFHISDAGHDLEGFVVHWLGRWYAYVNHCPHTGVNLNWLPDQFFDNGNQFIQCSLHGALFKPESGLCIRGPCVGDTLVQLPLVTVNGKICIELSKIREFNR